MNAFVKGLIVVDTAFEIADEVKIGCDTLVARTLQIREQVRPVENRVRRFIDFVDPVGCAKVLWSWLVPAYFVVEAIAVWLWDEHLWPTVIEVAGDVDRAIDAYVAECQQVKVEESPAVEPVEVVEPSPEVQEIMVEIAEVVAPVFERADAKGEVSDEELVRFAKSIKFPGSGKWAKSRKLSDGTRVQLLAKMQVVVG